METASLQMRRSYRPNTDIKVSSLCSFRVGRRKPSELSGSCHLRRGPFQRTPIRTPFFPTCLWCQAPQTALKAEVTHAGTRAGWELIVSTGFGWGCRVACFQNQALPCCVREGCLCRLSGHQEGKFRLHCGDSVPAVSTWGCSEASAVPALLGLSWWLPRQVALDD